MADRVKRTGLIKVHQALHGYADGHRLLACSLTLKPRDAKTMLVLSDISGPGARLGGSGYLTGYPLSDSGMYALARTWSAPEMPRPGCVWTHTLLVDFADLAVLQTPGTLVSSLRRPTSLEAAGYDVPVVVGDVVSGPLSSMDETTRAWWRRLLAGLYGKPRERVIAARPDDIELEPLVLAVWAQQWPRLRRGFRFCTLAVADRSGEGGAFDLQLLPTLDRTVRSRFPDAVEADRPDPDLAAWLEPALDDLVQPGVTGLRVFLHRVGGDVASGREAFAPLCRLHTLVRQFGERPTAVMDAIGLLDSEIAPSEARAARSIVAREAASQIGHLDNEALDFVLRELDLLDQPSLDELADAIGKAIWARDPSAIGSMLAAAGSARIVGERALAAIDTAELVSGLRRAPDLLPGALALRPEIVTEPSFWALKGAPRAEAIRASEESQARLHAALAAMISAGRDDLAEEAVRRFGVGRILDVLAPALDETGTEIPVGAAATWLRQSSRDAAAVAALLSAGKVRSRSGLVAIARATHPDAVPNDYGEDPWFTATKSAGGALSERGTCFFFAYLLGRALGQRSRNQAELAALSFDTVYSAAAESRLPDEAWRLVEYRLPWSIFWLEWDRCQRLRTGLSEMFVERDLAPAVFGQLTHDDALFALLADAAGRSSRGRHYLRRVSRALNDSNPQRFARRIRAIEEVAS